MRDLPLVGWSRLTCGGVMSVLVVLYNGFTEYEYLIPAMALHHQGVVAVAAGLEGRSVRGMTGLEARTGLTLDEADLEDYQAVLLPGIDRDSRDHVVGHQGLTDVIQFFDKSEKVIGAICAAPVLLASAGVLEGRRFCSEISTHPAFSGAIPSSEPAVRDGHIITGLGARPFHFTALLLEALIGRPSANEYREWAGI
jgi:protein deglycase